jgi:hypothetical protein
MLCYFVSYCDLCVFFLLLYPPPDLIHMSLSPLNTLLSFRPLSLPPVFMWVPTLMDVNGSDPVPTGLVFCTFMLSMTFGGLLFSLLLPVFPGGVEGTYSPVVPLIRSLHYVILACFSCMLLLQYFNNIRIHLSNSTLYRALRICVHSSGCRHDGSVL